MRHAASPAEERGEFFAVFRIIVTRISQISGPEGGGRRQRPLSMTYHDRIDLADCRLYPHVSQPGSTAGALFSILWPGLPMPSVILARNTPNLRAE